MDERPDYRVLSNRTMLFAGLTLLLVGAGLAVVLLAAFGQGTATLEVVRTVATVVVGVGGAGGLWLMARRQRSAEIALRQKEIDQSHAERVAAATEADAAERRLTELFTKAADQLGSDRPPVRLAGVYALARVGQNSVDQRRTIVDVLCAYLRMPDEDREVRRAVQKVLADKLRAGGWPGMDLDLSGALLVDCDLSGIEVRRATFAGAHFTGSTAFDEAGFDEPADFTGTRFDGETWFQQTRFGGGADFSRAELNGPYTGFNLATFQGGAAFRFARFGGAVEFLATRFRGDVDCTEAEFAGPVQVIAHVAGSAYFSGAVFRESVAFCRPAGLCRGSDFPTTFDGHVDFTGARFDGDADFGKVEFLGKNGWTVHQWIGRDGTPRGSVSSGAQFKNAVFAGTANFAQARFAGEVSGLP